MNTTIKNAVSEHILVETGIIRMSVKEGETVDVLEIQQAHQAHLTLSNNQSFCVLLDTTNGFFTVTPKAKELLASTAFTEHHKASAFVVSSISARLIGNFFLKFNKPLTPTQLFSTETEAIQWLRVFVNKPNFSTKVELTLNAK